MENQNVVCAYKTIMREKKRENSDKDNIIYLWMEALTKGRKSWADNQVSVNSILSLYFPKIKLFIPLNNFFFFPKVLTLNWVTNTTTIENLFHWHLKDISEEIKSKV